MKIKVSEASGAVLDFMAAKANVNGAFSDLTFKLVNGFMCATYEEDGKDIVAVFFCKGIIESIRARRVLRSPEGVLPDWYCPSRQWNHGGLIVDTEIHTLTERGGVCEAECFWPKPPDERRFCYSMKGDTKLVAACRAFVVSRLGSEVEVPDGLV